MNKWSGKDTAGVLASLAALLIGSNVMMISLTFLLNVPVWAACWYLVSDSEKLRRRGAHVSPGALGSFFLLANFCYWMTLWYTREGMQNFSYYIPYYAFSTLPVLYVVVYYFFAKPRLEPLSPASIPAKEDQGRAQKSSFSGARVIFGILLALAILAFAAFIAIAMSLRGPW